MPGLVEADDDGLYVLKFRGAGQGPKALVAELVAGELARAVGLPVPGDRVHRARPAARRAEPDPEIQELIAASGGRNVGLDFLPGVAHVQPGGRRPPAPELAAEVVWLDALMTNVDRSPQNPNLLLWHGRLWLIDHGAALYLQHAWEDPPAEARRPFPAIRDHVLLPCAGDIAAADARLAPRLDARGRGRACSAEVPDEWFAPRARAGVRRVPAPPAGGAARVRRRGGGGAPCRLARSSTRSCASCRAWSAASASTPASCCSAARGGSSRRGSRSTRRACRARARHRREAVRGHLDALCRIAAGDAAAGPIAALPASERFHWLVAPSSTIIQCSPVHTGLTDDPARRAGAACGAAGAVRARWRRRFCWPALAYCGIEGERVNRPA